MDPDRRSDSLRDTVGLDVERALAIDIAPGLHTQVRARIARERASAGWWGRRFAPLGAAAIAVAAVLIATRVGPNPKPAPQPQAPQRVTASPAPVAAIDVKRSASQPPRTVTPPVRSVTGQPERSQRVDSRRAAEPDVLLPPNERIALGLLLANIRQGRIDPFEPAARPLDAPLEPLDKISIEPIVIKPLARLEFVEGERQ